jgi:hypothetical protein
MSVESILSKFARIGPFHKDHILQTLQEDLEIVRDKANPLVLDLLQRNIRILQTHGPFFASPRQSKWSKKSKGTMWKGTRRMKGGMKLSGIVGWTLAAAVFTANYHGADRNLAILETLGMPYMTSQMVQSGVRTVQELMPLNEMMERVMSFVTPNPVIPEEVFKAGFETMYELEPYVQQDAFLQTKRQLNSLYADLNAEMLKDFSRLALSEAYVQDKQELTEDIKKSQKSPKGLVDSLVGLFQSEPLTAAEESLHSLLSSKEAQLSTYSLSVGLNTTAIREILIRVLPTTVPTLSLPPHSPLESSTNLVVYNQSKGKNESKSAFRSFAIDSRKSPKTTIARYKLPKFTGTSMSTKDFLHQVLDSMFTLPPILTEKNTLVLPQEFTAYYEYIQHTMDRNDELTIEEKRIILNIFTIHYMGICSRVIEAYETSMANTEIQNTVRKLNETHEANLRKIHTHVEGDPERITRVNGWIETHTKTFGFITDRVRDEMIHCSKANVCPMLTYKEVKNEKIILQKMHSTPYTISAKVLFSMVVTAILVGVPAMIVAFVASLANRTIDAHLGIIERLGVHPMRMDQQRLAYEHEQAMTKIRGSVGTRGTLRNRSTSRSSRIRLRDTAK